MTHESLQTTAPTGRLLSHMTASAAPFEREITAECTPAAPASARWNRTLGRTSQVDEHQSRAIPRW